MKIDPSKINDVAKGLGSSATKNIGNERASKNGKSDGTRTDASSARVDISAKGKSIQKVRELATPDMDGVDEEKVARLQKLIDDGNYSVDSEALADRIITEHISG